MGNLKYIQLKMLNQMVQQDLMFEAQRECLTKQEKIDSMENL